MLGFLEKWNFSSPFESDAQDETIHIPEPYSNRPIHHARPHFSTKPLPTHFVAKKSTPRRNSPDKKDEKLVA